jgi:hypothetical protein
LLLGDNVFDQGTFEGARFDTHVASANLQVPNTAIDGLYFKTRETAQPVTKQIAARYGDVNFRYGDGTIYAALHPGAINSGPRQPNRRGATIRIYDRNDQLVKVISSNAGSSILQTCSFELLETGPGQFNMTLTERIDIGHDYRVDIHLWNSEQPYYSGFIQRLPCRGTTELSWAISGFGFFQMAEDSLVTGSFPAGTYPHKIAAALAEDLRKDTGGRVSVGAISPTTQATQIFQVDSNGVVLTGYPIAYVTYQLAGIVNFLRTPMKDAMKTVTDLSGAAYTWGVDANRQFFFNPVSQKVNDDARWWVGKNMETYVPEEDSSKVKNRIYIKLGSVRHDLPPTDPLFATNFLDLPLEDLDSQAAFRVRSMVYSAAAALSPTDAVRAGAVQLDALKLPTQMATVTGIDFVGKMVKAEGKARITGRGGVVLELQKVKVVYTIQGSSIQMDVQLGAIEKTAGTFLAQVTRAAAEASLIQQNTQNKASTV